jgi:[protein-PII] uridylyltransferase
MGLAFSVLQQRNTGGSRFEVAVSKPSRRDSFAFLAVAAPPASAEALLEFGRQLHRAEMQRLKMRHRTGLGGREVVLLRSQLMDQLVLWSYQAVVKQSAVKPQVAEGLAIVALGGYGRQELAPYSDVDLMFLRKGRQNESENLMVQRMLCLLWDMGFQVGHSVRSIKDALQMAKEDLISQVSMLDARLLTGDAQLFGEITKRLQSAIQRNRRSFQERLFASIQERHAEQGGTAFIQEPNVKEAKGGLRDFHCAGWIARAFYPEQSLPEILAEDEISQEDWKRAVAAYEFLQRLRNELHFSTGRRSDILSHAMLTQVVKHFGFRGNRFQKDSEAFLRHYYIQVRRVSQVLETMMLRCQRETLQRPKWSGVGYFKIRLGKKQKAEAGKETAALSERPEKWMQHFRYQQSQGGILDETARATIRQKLQRLKQAAFSAPSLAADFRAILRNKGHVARVVRQMHELGFLGRVLPEFGRLTYLAQHDLYHKYTTDEHTLKALDILDQIARGDEPRYRQYQRILNEIHDSSTLYFALLMHDIGKGLGTGHSVRGARLVGKALARLGFDPDEAEKARVLVRHHLLMGHVSQRRNLEDPHTIDDFVKTVERLDILNMLLLITYADAVAVAPGVWTEWKDYLLWDLYYKAYDRLMFSEEVSPSAHAEVENVRQQVIELLKSEMAVAAIRNHFRLLPEKYALYTPVAQIAQHARLGQKLEQSEIVLEWEDHPDKGYTHLNLVSRDHAGLFAQISGALSAFNLNILSAQLNTRDDGVVFDLFQIGGQGGSYRLHQEDYPRVEKLLKKVITGQVSIEDYLKRHADPHPAAKLRRASFPPRVRLDNTISPSATVIEVQADDRVGLGYQIAKTLADLDLNITFAKLATEKAHAFDVFYVQDREGSKILDDQRMTNIVDRLKSDVMGLG